MKPIEILTKAIRSDERKKLEQKYAIKVEKKELVEAQG